MLPAALAWPGKRNRPVEVVEPPPPPPPPAPALDQPLFGGALPVDPGPLPEGLANLSAQGCHACHPDIHDVWASGPHARGPSPVLVRAAEEEPLCLGCHLPLVPQHDVVGGTANLGWDGGLRLEGVTCAACHVRDGRIAVSTEDAARATPPHPVALADGLEGAETCAACHQASWPGADVPLYDTFGEWQRSAWASAGVGCLDCHGDGTGHLREPDPARALSLLVRPDRRKVVRGQDAAVNVIIELQNTGAGHAYPTGTPFRGLQLKAELVGPAEAGEPLVVDLARTLEAAPPWRTTDDTRLQAGETRSLTWEVPIDPDLESGAWTLSVALFPTLRGDPEEQPIIVRQLPLQVE